AKTSLLVLYRRQAERNYYVMSSSAKIPPRFLRNPVATAGVLLNGLRSEIFSWLAIGPRPAGPQRWKAPSGVATAPRSPYLLRKDGLFSLSSLTCRCPDSHAGYPHCRGRSVTARDLEV